jgi:hypothetical protein
MILTPSYLRNNEAVVEAFGYWPSFQDAPVLAFRFTQEAGGEVEMTLHGSVRSHGFRGKMIFQWRTLFP